MKNETAIAEILLNIKAIQLNATKPYTWASGWKSPIYCDNRKILSFPQERNIIKQALSSAITTHFGNANLIAGVATAGIAWGALVADKLQLPFCYVRPKPKEHGLGNQVEGNYSPKQQVVIIEDLISTGKSSIQVIDVLQQLDLEIVGLISIFNYGFDDAKLAFENKGIKTISLTNYDALLPIAIQKNIVENSQLALLSSWRKAPSVWTGL